MKTNIINYINKLQGYKTAIKNLHWSSKHMSEHKLLDDIADSVANNQDEIAEMCQGLYGKIKLNELKPKRYNITNSKKMLLDMLRDTKSFYSSIKGRDLSGVRSVVETFIGEINKFVYLMEMCIKEDIKRNLKANLNESKNKFFINENELRKSINIAIKNVLKENIESNDILSKIDEFANDKIYHIEALLNEYKEEFENIKNAIPQIINNIQHITQVGNAYLDVDDDENFILHVELPSVQEGNEENNYNSELEDEIIEAVRNVKPNIGSEIYLDETINNGTCIMTHVKIQIPEFYINKEF